jgi:glycosyltransferase involved in cell wall biosynthesis
MKGRVSIEEFKHKKDVFLALNQALPIYASGKIISFCHGLSYHFFPQYYSKKDVVRLNRQLKEMIKRSDKIIVSSKKVKDEITSINQSIDSRIVVLPFGIPYDMSNTDTTLGRPYQSRNAKNKYFLFVGNNQPIKNINFIKQAFNSFKRDKKYKDFKLKILTNNISRERLKDYYQDATALLTASHYESFNFPVLEALSLGCPVVGLKSAIIPELKSYVNVADNLDEFIEKMKKITKKPTVQLINQLHVKFNWNNYVKNLVDLY